MTGETRRTPRWAPLVAKTAHGCIRRRVGRNVLARRLGRPDPDSPSCTCSGTEMDVSNLGHSASPSTYENEVVA